MGPRDVVLAIGANEHVQTTRIDKPADNLDAVRLGQSEQKSGGI